MCWTSIGPGGCAGLLLKLMDNFLLIHLLSVRSNLRDFFLSGRACCTYFGKMGYFSLNTSPFGPDGFAGLLLEERGAELVSSRNVFF